VIFFFPVRETLRDFLCFRSHQVLAERYGLKETKATEPRQWSNEA
jgi:hypothetical protein